MKVTKRRQFLTMLGLGSAGLGATALPVKSVQAHHTDTHFEDESPHKLVYQCNKADDDYLSHILFSCGEMLRKYGDDIELIIVVLGPGLNLLAKKPKRPVATEHQQRVESLATYGVRFHACGNTMKAMKWSEKDLLDVSEVVTIGADSIMSLQEQGFSYISW